MGTKKLPAPSILARLLLDLLSDDWEAAVAAARSLDTVDMDALRKSVQDVLRRPEFVGRRFAEEIHVRQRQLSAGWRASLERSSDRFSNELDSIYANERTEDGRISDEGRRRIREMHRRADEEDETQSMDRIAVYSMVTLVYEWVTQVSPPSIAGLREMLASKRDRMTAYGTIAKMGPAAAALGDDLIEHLSGDFNSSVQYEAGVAVLRGNPSLITKLLTRFWAIPSPHPYPGICGSIICELGHECAKVDPDLPRKLLEGTHSADDQKVVECTVALGGVTRGTDVAVDRLIELSTHPREIIQGVAIYALGRVRSRSDIVVPHLISLIDTFEEFDPDMGYGGEHARIAYALAEHGPAAASAIPWVLGRLRSPSAGRGEDGDPESSDLELLMAIGPAASAALPILEEWRREYERQIDEEFVERIGKVIAAIRGEGGQSRSSLP